MGWKKAEHKNAAEKEGESFSQAGLVAAPRGSSGDRMARRSRAFTGCGRRTKAYGTPSVCALGAMRAARGCCLSSTDVTFFASSAAFKTGSRKKGKWCLPQEYSIGATRI